MRPLLALLALVRLALSLPAQEPRPRPGPWQIEIAYEGTTKLGGLAVGDLDGRPGAEIAFVGADGGVRVLRRTSCGWEATLAFRAPGEVIQCAVGDADPHRPGAEILAVGKAAGGEDEPGPGAAYLVFRTPDGWRGERIFQDDALLHGAAVERGELFVTGFTRNLYRLHREGGRWVAERLGSLPGAGKCIALTPAGPVVACRDGSLVRFARTDQRWAARVLDRRPAGRARLGAAAGAVLSADDDGALTLVARDGPTVIYHEDRRLRGAVLADLDPAVPGLEAATAGYAGRVTVLYRRGGKWHPYPLFQDRGGFHHLAAGPGFLAACGYGGRVILLRPLPRP